MTQHVVIDYTNWKGERSLRRINPVALLFTSNEFHPEEQWLLLADDLDKNARRWFAMKDVHMWAAENERVPE